MPKLQNNSDTSEIILQEHHLRPNFEFEKQGPKQTEINSSVSTIYDTLDKLAQLSTKNTKNREKCDKKFIKDVKRKYVTSTISKHLIALENDFKKQYINAHLCSNSKTWDFEKQAYHNNKPCKTRICTQCAAVRTAKSIHQYKSEIERLIDAHFTTLTHKTVKGKNLQSAIKRQKREFRKILQKLTKKQNIHINGIVKFECTIRPDGYFHPHIHIIHDKEQNAHILIKEWQKLYGKNLTSKKAQKTQKITENSELELFKYHAKPLYEVDKKLYANIKAIDTMHQAYSGLRVIQPFGNVKAQDNYNQDETEKTKKFRNAEILTWLKEDYFTPENVPLTNQKLSKNMEIIINH